MYFLPPTTYGIAALLQRVAGGLEGPMAVSVATTVVVPVVSTDVVTVTVVVVSLLVLT